MKIILLTLAILAIRNVSAGVGPSLSEGEFCADRSNNKQMEQFVRGLVKDSDNLMEFENQGGIGGNGVCWWHSRFQRNALYLTIFDPSEPRPGHRQRVDIVKRIRQGNQIVKISGYANFKEFSLYNKAIILQELGQWQKGDGVTKFSWVAGVSGNIVAGADRLKKEMDELYQYVTVQGNIAYQKLQLKGIPSHAWLVINMKKVANGYDLEILESNEPNKTLIFSYRYGNDHFYSRYYGKFSPYTERKNEMVTIKNAIKKYCNE